MFIYQKKVTSVFEFSSQDKALIRSVVNRYRYLGDRDDLEQNAGIALWRANLKFKPELGVKFSTFAIRFIRNAVFRDIQNSREIHIPEYKLSKARKLSVLNEELEQKSGRRVTEFELAHAANMTIEQIAELKTAIVYPTSLDKPLYDEGSTTLVETVKDEDSASKDVLFNLIDSEFKNEIMQLLSQLRVIEKKVLIGRFGLYDEPKRTLQELADFYGVTKERIRQIEAKALRRLRMPARNNKLRSFLQ